MYFPALRRLFSLKRFFAPVNRNKKNEDRRVCKISGEIMVSWLIIALL